MSSSTQAPMASSAASPPPAPPPPSSAPSSCGGSNRTVFIYHLPRRPDKSKVLELAAKYGAVTQCFVNQGRGQAIIEFSHRSEALRMISDLTERPFIMEPSKKPIKPQEGTCEIRPRDTTSYEAVRRQVESYLIELTRRVITRECERRRLLRIERYKRHRTLMRELDRHAEETGSLDLRVCWDYLISHGLSCPRGDTCPFRHVLDLPVSAIPPSLRHFMVEDLFPVMKSECPYKTSINQTVVQLSSCLANRRCLVLEGQACNTVKALRACLRQPPRTAEDIYVPNLVTETYLAIRDSGLCTAYHGSVRHRCASNFLCDMGIDAERAFLDEHPSGRFGLIYLDYCGRLYAGKKNVEKSPAADLERVFTLGTCDPRGCLLAVCLREEKEGSDIDAPRCLNDLVCRLASENNLAARRHGEPFHYEGLFFSAFFVAQDVATLECLHPGHQG